MNSKRLVASHGDKAAEAASIGVVEARFEAVGVEAGKVDARGIEGEGELPHRPEGRPVMPAGAEPGEGVPVKARGVTGVGLPAIARAALREAGHGAVPQHFRDDRCGGDRQAAAIAADDALDAAGQGGRPIAVHQGEVGRRGQPPDRAAHRQQGGVQDVDADDLTDGGGADADFGGPGGAQGGEGGQPLLGRQLLRVVEQACEPARHPVREHDGRRDDRPGKRPPADLVDAGDPPAGLLLQGEVGHRCADSRRGRSRATRSARIVWLDIERAKGLAILLVVFGHLVARQGPAGVGWYEKARILVYLFHMPLFMYLSGYVAFRSGAARTSLRSWPALVRRRAARLLLPFLAFGLVILAGKLFADAWLGPVDNLPSGPWQGLRALVWDTDRSPATSVWYLAVLFAYSIAAPVLLRAGRPALLLVAVLLWALAAPPLLYADRISAYFIFFVAGGLAADAGPGWLAFMGRARWAFAAAFFGLLGCVCAALFPVDMTAGTHTIGYRALMLATAAVAIPALHGAVRAGRLARSRTLLWLGGSSFAIYLLNTICIGVAKAVLLRFVSWDGVRFIPIAAALMLAGTLGPIALRELAQRLGQRGQARIAENPPSTGISSPVIQRASSLARNSAA